MMQRIAIAATLVSLAVITACSTPIGVTHEDSKSVQRALTRSVL